MIGKIKFKIENSVNRPQTNKKIIFLSNDEPSWIIFIWSNRIF